MKAWPFTLLLISIATHADSNFGVWSTSCDDDGFSITIDKNTNPLVILTKYLKRKLIFSTTV